MTRSGDSVGLLLWISWIIAEAGAHRSLVVTVAAAERDEVTRWLVGRGAKVPVAYGPQAK